VCRLQAHTFVYENKPVRMLLADTNQLESFEDARMSSPAMPGLISSRTSQESRFISPSIQNWSKVSPENMNLREQVSWALCSHIDCGGHHRELTGPTRSANLGENWACPPLQQKWKPFGVKALFGVEKNKATWRNDIEKVEGADVDVEIDKFWPGAVEDVPMGSPVALPPWIHR
jgi:hypothetical protein